VIVTENGADQARYVVTSSVRLKLGDDIRFDGFGLKGRFTGNVEITDRPGQLTSARGEVRVIDGTYRAYGQNLTIERGRLVYLGGPVDNPGLDIRAVRVVGDVTAGFNVSGFLQQPVLTVFSQPAMTETEALSYLLLGRPLQRDDTGKDSELSAALLAVRVGIGGASLVGQSIARDIGIEEFDIETESTTGAVTLKLGTYLSPRLYVGYGRGLVEQINTLFIRYRLTDKLTVKGESSSEAVGGDLIYTYSKD
jgi:translocation and assembly module TamB